MHVFNNRKERRKIKESDQKEMQIIKHRFSNKHSINILLKKEKPEMKLRKLFTISFALFFVLYGTTVLAGGHGHKKDKKVGILLVAFGSSEESAQVSFENIDKT
jgi:hypothetical protein